MFNRQQLVGKWFRSDVQPNGDIHTEMAQLTVDGAYEFSFIIYDKNNKLVQQNIELGDWGLVGNIHFTIAKAEVIDDEALPMDMADENNYHAYQVLNVDAREFKYQHIVSKEVFILKRVVDNIAHC